MSDCDQYFNGYDDYACQFERTQRSVKDEIIQLLPVEELIKQGIRLIQSGTLTKQQLNQLFGDARREQEYQEFMNSGSEKLLDYLEEEEFRLLQANQEQQKMLKCNPQLIKVTEISQLDIIIVENQLSARFTYSTNTLEGQTAQIKFGLSNVLRKWDYSYEWCKKRYVEYKKALPNPLSPLFWDYWILADDDYPINNIRNLIIEFSDFGGSIGLYVDIEEYEIQVPEQSKCGLLIYSECQCRSKKVEKVWKCRSWQYLKKSGYIKEFMQEVDPDVDLNAFIEEFSRDQMHTDDE